MTATDQSSHNAIARLNDSFRAHPGSDWMITAGIQDRGPLFVLTVIDAVRAFSSFATDSDPHGEHDFGAFTYAGERLFWKIDYYGRDLNSGSPNPADSTVTRRILTIMLASEY